MRRTALSAACCLLGFVLCFAGCRSQSTPPPVPQSTPPPVPQPSVEFKIPRAEAHPPVVQPGAQVTFLVQCRVSAHRRQISLPATVKGRLLFNQQLLRRLSWDNITLEVGTQPHAFDYRIPEEAAEGAYTMQITVTPQRLKGVTVDIPFEVRRAPQ